MIITDLRATSVTVPLEAPLRHANGCHWGRFVRTIAGRSNRWIEFVDGDGTTHRFAGFVDGSGVVYWIEPPGVHLYLRQYSTTDTTRWWAFTRPDRVTFFYNQAGPGCAPFPTRRYGVAKVEGTLLLN